jgi:hypothetical protein
MPVPGDIQPYNWNEGRIEKSNSEIIKKIEVEENFSSYVHKDLKSKRFGIGGCCSFDKLEGSIIDKELCDWKDLTKPIFGREYKDIAWLYNTQPWPEWVQFGDFDPNIGPCINNDCPEYKDPVGSTKWVQLMLDMDTVVQADFTPTGDWAGANPPTAYEINSSGTAVMYALAKNWEDPTDDNWVVVGKSKVPTGPTDDALGDGGNLWEHPVSGLTFWRFHVYYNVPGSGFQDGAIPGQVIKFIVVDGDVQWELKFNENIWPTIGGTAGFGDYHVYPPVTYGVPYCAVCIAGYEFVQKGTRFNQICDDRFEDCWMCGMEPVYDDGASEPPFIDSLPIGFKCVDDSACIYIEVKNQCGAPIQNYPIILDGIDVGSTDDYGIFRFTITDTWIAENGLGSDDAPTTYQGTPFGDEDYQLVNDYSTHTINTCEFCFITWGECNQHKIEITVDDPRKDCQDCKPAVPALKCVDITPTPVVVTEPDSEVISSWICDTDYDRQWYGCVEIIGTQGYATQAECEENCIEPRPDPTYWRCMQAIGVQGATGSTCVEIDGDNPGMANTYDTEAECLEGCQDWRTEGCWRCSGMPNYAPEFVPGQESNFVDCFDSLSAFQTMVAQGNGFCEEPPRSLYQGCGCNLLPNVFNLLPNNGDTANPQWATFATLAACQNWSTNNPDCVQVPPGPDWDTLTVEGFLSVPNGTMGLPSYPYYGAADEMPIELIEASNDLTFFTNNPNQQNRFIMVPIMWPGDSYWSGNDPDWTEDFRVGSDITFRIHISYEATMPGEIMPFGPGNSWVINAADLPTSSMADHSKGFYVLNNYSILQVLGLPIGSLNNNVPGLDIWAPDYSDTFVDYVSIEQNYNYPNGYDGMGTVNYYYDIKFNRDLCITNGAAQANQMPLIEGGGVMLYMPIVLLQNCNDDAPLFGADKTINVNFIPATEIGNEYYVTGINQYTGDSVNYQVDEGISGTINGCVGTNCPDCKPESSRIACYRCLGGNQAVGMQFAGPDCPQGWTTDDTPCTPDWDVDPFEG